MRNLNDTLFSSSIRSDLRSADKKRGCVRSARVPEHSLIILLFSEMSSGFLHSLQSFSAVLCRLPFRRYHRGKITALPQAVRRISQQILLVRRSGSGDAVLAHCDALARVEANRIAGYVLHVIKVDDQSSDRTVEGPAGENRDELLHVLIEAVFPLRGHYMQLAPFLLDDLDVVDPDPGALRSADDRNVLWQIVVAHDLSTIVNADKIMVFDNGRLSAEGTHEELLKKSELYRQLTLKEAN